MYSFDTILIIACITLLILWVWDYRRWRAQLPPGPPCIPLIGNLGQIDLSNEISTFSRLRNIYGDVFCYVMGSQPTIVINGLTAIQDLIVKKGDAFTDRPERSIVSRMNNGLGLIGSTGDMWKEHRSFAVRAVKHAGYRGHSIEEIIQNEVQILLNNITKLKQKAIDPSDMLNLRVISILRWLTLGKQIRDKTDEERFLEMTSLIRAMLSDPAFKGIWLYIRLLGLKFLPGTRIGRGPRNRRIISFLQQEVDICKKSINEEHPRCFVDAYMLEQKRRTGNPICTFTDDQLVSSIRDLIVAGLDTTVTSVKWALVHLINYPEVQKKMRLEVHRVIGPSRLPCMTDQSNLPYCRAVINESLRLCHVFPIPPSRGVNYDVTWNDYKIPHGAMVLINLESVAKDPETFQDPELFDPNRFLNDEGTFDTNKLIFPFSAGKRSCLGEGIARMQLFLFLTSLIQRFEILPEEEWKLPSTDSILFATRFPKHFKARFVDIE